MKDARNSLRPHIKCDSVPGFYFFSPAVEQTNIRTFNMVGKAEGSSPLGRQRNRREDNIKTDIRKIGWNNELIWLRIGKMSDCFENNNKILGSTKCGEFLDSVRIQSCGNILFRILLIYIYI
jgi:hypothetical protein